GSHSFPKFVFLLALTALLTACSKDPQKQKLAFLNDGERYFRTGKYAEAVIQFRNAIQIDPRFAAAHYQLGQTYLALNNPDPAFRALTNSVILDPANTNAQLDRTGLLLKRQQLNEAQSVLQKILSKEPNNVKAHILLGQKHSLARDFSAAIVE